MQRLESFDFLSDFFSPVLSVTTLLLFFLQKTGQFSVFRSRYFAAAAQIAVSSAEGFEGLTETLFGGKT